MNGIRGAPVLLQLGRPDISPLRIHPPSLAYPGEPDSSVRKMQNSIKIRIVPNFNGAHLHTVISALLQ